MLLRQAISEKKALREKRRQQKHAPQSKPLERRSREGGSPLRHQIKEKRGKGFLLPLFFLICF
ncbi:MAG: hypothetical protein A3J24_07020 [Deltaproteobacteria bacterium RIFCSPLOWO2_02_FULL_53_8]|nr:MAG: hypothetical protein A3J24_07020 [Deltaproteobacteria bacterium RIFCSPLOWO2_02_FULL_53_8]